MMEARRATAPQRAGEGVMDFALSREQVLFQRTVRRFADGVLRPVAAEVDERDAFPPAVLQRTAESGLFGLLVPRQFGGSAVDTLHWALAMEAVAQASAAMASILIAHGALACVPLARAFESAGGAESPLAALASDRVGAAVLPPGPDARLAAPQTPLHAAASGDGWRISGRAAAVANAGLASVYLLWAEIDAAHGGREIAAFLLQPDHHQAAGVQERPACVVAEAAERMGLRGAPVADVALAQCWVSSAAQLAADAPAAVLQESRDLYQLGTAAQALGIAQSALDAALAYAGERRQFGRPIGRFQGLRWLLADLHLAVEAARLLVWRAAWLRDQGQPFGEAAALAKLAAAPMATHVATKAVQVHGGYGYLRDLPLQRYLRDAKGTELLAGTSGTQRTRIADALLPLPS